jgi:hypothetical protein
MEVNAGHLRPLLPADGRCAVVVTSREPLLGLEDAIHLEVRRPPIPVVRAVGRTESDEARIVAGDQQ